MGLAAPVFPWGAGRFEAKGKEAWSMHESIMTMNLRLGSMRAALAIWREQVLPVLKTQPGLVHIGLMPDGALQRLTVTSVWERKSDKELAEAQGRYLQAMRELERYLVPGAEPAWVGNMGMARN